MAPDKHAACTFTPMSCFLRAAMAGVCPRMAHGSRPRFTLAPGAIAPERKAKKKKGKEKKGGGINKVWTT